MPEVAELLRELRPEAGLGSAVEGLVAFLHHAYLFWLDGEQLLTVDEAGLNQLLSSAPTAALPARRTARYLQIPPFRVWGVPVAGTPPEPLDGWFALRGEGGTTLDALAIFGMHPGREGFTTVEVSGERSAPSLRPNGSALYSPLLTGGAAAALASVDGEAELLELAWRGEAL